VAVAETARGEGGGRLIGWKPTPSVVCLNSDLRLPLARHSCDRHDESRDRLAANGCTQLV